MAGASAARILRARSPSATDSSEKRPHLFRLYKLRLVSITLLPPLNTESPTCPFLSLFATRYQFERHVLFSASQPRGGRAVDSQPGAVLALARHEIAAGSPGYRLSIKFLLFSSSISIFNNNSFHPYRSI